MKTESEYHPARGQIESDEEVPNLEKFWKPHFVQHPPSKITILEGKFVRLDVKVSGLPLPEVHFLKNGGPVRRDYNHKIVVRENNIQSLLIDKVSLSDAAEYTCIATNRAGTEEIHVELVVEKQAVLSRPIFKQKLQGPIKIGYGEDFEMEIQVTGFPVPHVGWKHGSDGIIPDGGRICLESESSNEYTRQILTIRNCTKQDAGWYSCCCVNSSGIATSNCKVEILDDWELGRCDLDGNPLDMEEDHVKIGPSRTNKLQPFMKDAMKHAYSQEAQGNVKHRWNDDDL